MYYANTYYPYKIIYHSFVIYYLSNIQQRNYTLYVLTEFFWNIYVSKLDNEFLLVFRI